jgi:glycosyltransferase involved in cell wall biosynthesis
MKIIYIALENIEQRYTPMMNSSLGKLCDVVVYPEFNYPEVIEKGQFLDVNKTIIFKSKQLQMISEMFYNGKVNDGDVFLVGDIFFPGIESIKYMAELQGISVKVYGFNYAGRADKTDFVQKLGGWADYSEKGYHLVCDGIFVGSQFHKAQVCDHFRLPASMVHVTGYIWDRDYVENIFDGTFEKEDFVIFPHRLSKEKGIKELLQFAAITDKKILVTSSGNRVDIELPENINYVSNLSKKNYYRYLARAKYYLSTAYQETFGYTLQEAIHFGCKIAVPDRACYKEMVPLSAVYKSVETIDFVDVDESYTEQWNKNAHDVIRLINNERRK